MKESKFIAQNKKNWNEFETDLRTKENIAVRLSKLFIQVTDDLSFARTYYKNRSVRVYLNGLAQKLFNGLYRNQSISQNSFLNFWKVELPLNVYNARKEFLTSLLIFLGALLIGVLSAYFDKDFVKLILGPQYVSMTLENIQKHDPMAVYKQANQVDMFLGITVNNLRVALITFVLGFLFSIGTIYMLIFNGIMLGSFQYFFIERGLFRESFLTIWQHGTLEISCIIIAGAAGIAMGKGLLFPGTFSRVESFKKSTVGGMKIFVGIAPIIVLAGFIESFFTRFTDVGDFFRVVVILFSLSFIVFYFIIYPRKIALSHIDKTSHIEKNTYKPPVEYNFSKVLSSDEVMGYTVEFLNKFKLQLTFFICIMAALHSFLFIIYEKYIGKGISYESLQIFKNEGINLQLILGTIELIFILIFWFKRVNSEIYKFQSSKKKYFVVTIINSILISVAIGLQIFVFKWFVLISVVFVFPFLYLLFFNAEVSGKFLFSSIGNTFSMLQNSWTKYIWNSVKLILLFYILYVLFNTPLVWNYISIVISSITKYPEIQLYIRLGIEVFLIFWVFVTYLNFIIITQYISYFDLKETVTASNLLARIEKFGVRNSIFGFEKEK